MKIWILVLLLVLSFSPFCFADLFRYQDKVSGEERGICYSDEPINNPEWTVTKISEEKKDYYIKIQKDQLDAKPKPKTLEERISTLEKKVESIKPN